MQLLTKAPATPTCLPSPMIVLWVSAITALCDEAGMQEQVELTTAVLEAAELEEHAIAQVDAPGSEKIGSRPLPDLGLDTINEF